MRKNVDMIQYKDPTCRKGKSRKPHFFFRYKYCFTGDNMFLLFPLNVVNIFCLFLFPFFLFIFIILLCSLILYSIVFRIRRVVFF